MFYTFETISGPLSTAVPGEVVGYHEAKTKFGNPAVSWESLIQPTIDLCERGLPVTESLSKALDKSREKVANDETLTYAS